MEREAISRAAGCRVKDRREEARWKERCSAILRWRGKDWRAISGDLSCGGAKLGVQTCVPRVGDEVIVALALDSESVQAQGIVRHVRKTTWGSIVGIEFDDVDRRHMAQVLAGSRW